MNIVTDHSTITLQPSLRLENHSKFYNNLDEVNCPDELMCKIKITLDEYRVTITIKTFYVSMKDNYYPMPVKHQRSMDIISIVPTEKGHPNNFYFASERRGSDEQRGSDERRGSDEGPDQLMSKSYLFYDFSDYTCDIVIKEIAETATREAYFEISILS